MVADWLKLRLSTSKSIEAIVQAMEIVAAFIKYKNSRQLTFELRREIRVYVSPCLQNFDALYGRADVLLLQTPAIVEAKPFFARFFEDDCRFLRAIELYDECVKDYEDTLGPEDDKTIRAISLQANYHMRFGDPAKAAMLYSQVMARINKKVSVKPARCYNKQWQHSKAKVEYQKALDDMKDLTENDPRIIDCQVQMTLNESKLSACDAVVPLVDALRRLDEWSSNRCSKDPALPEVEINLRLAILEALSSIYFEREDYVEAEATFGRGLGLAEQYYGAENGETLRFAHNLAVAYNNQTKFAEPKKLYRRTLDRYEASYGPESEMAVKVCHCYGHVLESQYKHVEATSLHLRAVNGLQKLRKAGDDLTTTTFDCLVESFVILGDKLEAENFYRTALVNRMKELGADHVKTVDIASHLADSTLKKNG